MTFKTPSFWYENGAKFSLPALALTPLSWLYGLGYMIHQRTRAPLRVKVPVICAGNINAGGSGKTPVALALMTLARATELADTPFFLARGYGDDEHKILSRHAPLVLNRDRAAGARQAMAQGADMIIMDDGLQNPGLHKDIKFAVIDGAMGFGNGRMIPAGPLRQSLKAGMKSADAFILIGEDTRGVLDMLPKDKPCFRAMLEPVDGPPADRPYVAFAGLGYPEKFFTFLRTLGFEIAQTVSFPDHHGYRQGDISALREKAQAHGAGLITTEKDFVKLPEDFAKDVHMLPVRLVWEDPPAVFGFIRDRLGARA